MICGSWLFHNSVSPIATHWMATPANPSSISKSQSEAEELINPVLTSKSKIIWKLDFVSERFCPKIEGFSQNRVCIF